MVSVLDCKCNGMLLMQVNLAVVSILNLAVVIALDCNGVLLMAVVRVLDCNGVLLMAGEPCSGENAGL